MLVRSYTFHLCEEERACCHCKKTLAHADGTLFILSPSMNKTYEFCSWYCLYKFIVRLLKDKVADKALKKTDLLKRLGCNMKWGMKLTKEQLESPIEDPIEDTKGDAP